MKELLMGNEAIAMGAIAAGVDVVSGYPGTPSTEVLETIAKRNNGGIYVEWSINEKAAMEVAAGAAYTGARVMVTMKQVGLNVASDPLMCVNYVGIKGGMVVLVADDPGPISSQTEQDTRHFASYARIPLFDPVTPEDAFVMIQDAFNLSEELKRPVIMRPTTRVCHSCAAITYDDDLMKSKKKADYAFEKDAGRWVIFPRLANNSKRELFSREDNLSEYFSSYSFNTITGSGRYGIVCSGISAAYVQDLVKEYENHNHRMDVTIFTVATPYPFPEKLAEKFMNQVDQMIVFEELDPVLEDAFIYLCGKKHIHKDIYGKHTGHTIIAGENDASIIEDQLCDFLHISKLDVGQKSAVNLDCAALENEAVEKPELSNRPPLLCAGCPHRASFYAVKQAMKGTNCVFSGDIGCYTLGNAKPLDMTDTCLCMGAGITIPQGMMHVGNKAVHFGFVGDSTFFASGITGVINAVYNKADVVICILDNATTAMTGHQPHPGIGKTMMNEVSTQISIEKILKAIDVTSVRTVDPLRLDDAVETVKLAAAESGVRCIIFKSPCIAIVKHDDAMHVDTQACLGCKKCIMELGCPALSMKDQKAVIDTTLCTSCGLCAQICPAGCILKPAAKQEQ